MPVHVTHNIHGPTRRTGCVTHVFVYWTLKTIFFRDVHTV